MKFVLYTYLLCFAFYLQAQQAFDFLKPLPPGSDQVTGVSWTYHGTYSSGQVDIDYQFDDAGITAISTVFQSISRETIRESTQYSVRNGFLFGVAETDSLPCELQGEYYHFAIQFKEPIIGKGSKNILTKVNDQTYIINFEENGRFTPSRLTFKGKQLTVEHFTYAESSSAFDAIQLKEAHPTNALNYITLDPTSGEWQALPMAELFERQLIFQRL